MNDILNYELSKCSEGNQEKGENYSLTVEYYDDLLEIEIEKQVTVYAQSEAEAIIAARNMVKGFLKATIN